MPARRHIRLTFIGTGESVTAEMLDEEAPKTCQMVWERLPFEQDLIHGRYSGMELFVLLNHPQPAPAENQTQLPLPGEILYWYAHDTSVTGGGKPVAQIRGEREGVDERRLAGLGRVPAHHPSGPVAPLVVPSASRALTTLEAIAMRWTSEGPS